MTQVKRQRPLGDVTTTGCALSVSHREMPIGVRLRERLRCRSVLYSLDGVIHAAAIRFGYRGLLSGIGGWQWDRRVTIIRAVAVGRPELVAPLANLLRERGHVVVARLEAAHVGQFVRDHPGLGANVFALCVSQAEQHAVKAVCDYLEQPVVVFANHVESAFYSDCLQDGAFACLGVPALPSEALALLGIAATRWDQFAELRRKVDHLSVRVPERGRSHQDHGRQPLINGEGGALDDSPV